MIKESEVRAAYNLAKECYASEGVDTEKAMKQLSSVAISLNCWQGDDIAGYELPFDGKTISSGTATTGNYPGKARTISELQSDVSAALSMIPGSHRFNLHGIYLDHGGKRIDRNEIEPKHFKVWVDWAKDLKIGLDLNPTFFGHPKANDGFTLTHPKSSIRNFWIEHGMCCREIGAYFGKSLGSPCLNNVWIPDGYKDNPVDRLSPRKRLLDSLDKMFAKKYNSKHLLDSVECKLFGLGSECYVPGSHEFYWGYATTRKILMTYDNGHFHPTESIADKFSSAFLYNDKIALHVTRGIHWDSDHVVCLTDDVISIAQELVRNNFLPRTYVGLDFFDASINRVAAWIIGTRNLQKALLQAMLEPIASWRKLELAGDYTSRLALTEEAKSLPWQAVWDMFCLQQNVPVGSEWLIKIKEYEKDVLSHRN